MTAAAWAIAIFALTLLAVAAVGLAAGRRLLAAAGYRLAPIAENDREAEPTARTTVQDVSAEASGRPNRADDLPGIADLEVSDVMIHRTAMHMVDADSRPETVVREILQSPYTRVPVWRGANDNIVGVIHTKDLLRALHEVDNDFARIDLQKVASKPWFVPDTTTLPDQLNAFLRRKAHIAIVVDEYGEVEGLVTLEDIIEEIVGDIADEHDIDVQGLRPQADGSVILDGSVSIRDLNRALGWSLPDEEAVTIAGLVIHEAQSIPDEKQAFTFHGKRFVVLKREKNRIVRLRAKAVGTV